MNKINPNPVKVGDIVEFADKSKGFVQSVHYTNTSSAFAKVQFFSDNKVKSLDFWFLKVVS
jgi:uncharacterized protein YkvS